MIDVYDNVGFRYNVPSTKLKNLFKTQRDLSMAYTYRETSKYRKFLVADIFSAIQRVQIVESVYSCGYQENVRYWGGVHYRNVTVERSFTVHSGIEMCRLLRVRYTW